MKLGVVMLKTYLSPRFWGLSAGQKKFSVGKHAFLPDSQENAAFLPVSQHIDALQTKSPSVPSTEEFFCMSWPHQTAVKARYKQ